MPSGAFLKSEGYSHRWEGKRNLCSPPSNEQLAWNLLSSTKTLNTAEEWDDSLFFLFFPTNVLNISGCSCSLTGIHFSPQGQSSRKNWGLSFARKIVNEATDKKNCSVPIDTWRSSKTGRQHTLSRPPKRGVRKTCLIWIQKTSCAPNSPDINPKGWSRL